MENSPGFHVYFIVTPAEPEPQAQDWDLQHTPFPVAWTPVRIFTRVTDM